MHMNNGCGGLSGLGFRLNDVIFAIEFFRTYGLKHIVVFRFFLYFNSRHILEVVFFNLDLQYNQMGVLFNMFFNLDIIHLTIFIQVKIIDTFFLAV